MLGASLARRRSRDPKTETETEEVQPAALRSQSFPFPQVATPWVAVRAVLAFTEFATPKARA